LALWGKIVRTILLAIVAISLAADLAVAADWQRLSVAPERPYIITAKWYTDFPPPVIANPEIDPCVATVGRLGVPSWRGTAELVLDPREVLTSSIVASADRVRFYLGYNRGKSSFDSWGTVVARGGAYINERGLLKNLVSDWAIVVLDKSAPKAISPMHIYPDTAFNSANMPYSQLAIVGYPDSFQHGEIPAIAKRCEIDAVDRNGLLLHTCGADRGSSGGPIFLRLENGDCQVVGIQVPVVPKPPLRARYAMSIANGAVPADRFRSAALTVLELLEAGETADQIRMEISERWRVSK
jgi:hypothetical protein